MFIGYRLVITGYNFGWLIYNIHISGAKLFIFLTNWTFLILNLFFLLATSVTISALYCEYRKSRRATSPSTNDKPEKTTVQVTKIEGIHESAQNKDNELPSTTVGEEDTLRFQHKLMWLLYVLSANGGLLVTVGYWTVLFEESEPVDANNITKHALNSVFMLTDTFLSSIPVRLFHFIYPLLYIIIYLAFTVVYWLLGGTNIEGQPYIYSLLNYNDYDASTGCLVGFFLLVVQPVLQLILFGSTKLRDCCFREKEN